MYAFLYYSYSKVKFKKINQDIAAVYDLLYFVCTVKSVLSITYYLSYLFIGRETMDSMLLSLHEECCSISYSRWGSRKLVKKCRRKENYA